ncbi:hypothetical protein BN1044_04227 [Hafnia alvei]|uniref:Uncharacterized protein n=1 Tax=Hafnia alvei TaxID=569 RepID=A0A1C6Z6K2_HAFAL|nr:hypothetical protein BN1044_04227 [Hafnia alvei]
MFLNVIASSLHAFYILSDFSYADKRFTLLFKNANTMHVLYGKENFHIMGVTQGQVIYKIFIVSEIMIILYLALL